jgi:hypothetical protein
MNQQLKTVRHDGRETRKGRQIAANAIQRPTRTAFELSRAGMNSGEIGYAVIRTSYRSQCTSQGDHGRAVSHSMCPKGTPVRRRPYWRRWLRLQRKRFVRWLLAPMPAPLGPYYKGD